MSTLSIAMCTYNGATFLREQLESILAQTLPPNEVVVRDDGSTDATHQILAEFAGTAPFPVTVLVNPEKLGIPDNFWAAIRDARGDLIALCDQDDVWHQHKLERAVEVLDNDPDIGATFSDGWCIDASGVRNGRRLWEAAHFTGRFRTEFEAGHELDALMEHSAVTGATLTFRSSVRPSLVPWPSIPHDYWISVAIATQMRVHAIREPLISYRLHDSNTLGFPKGDTFTYYRTKLLDPRKRAQELADEAELSQAVVDLFSRVPCPYVTREQRDHMIRRAEWLAYRRDLPRGFLKRLGPVLTHARSGDYATYSTGTLSWMVDLLLPRAPNSDRPQAGRP